MVKLDATKQSPASILANAKNSRRAYDKCWNAAARAPIFCKISKKQTPDGKSKKFYRTAKLISSHAFHIAASGAAANVAARLEAECGAVREDAEAESARAPWLPQFSKGAKMIVEQFLCALAQEATMKAHAVRESSNRVRLSKRDMRIGYDVTYDNVFANSTLMPKAVIVAPPAAKRSSKKKAGKGKGGEEDPEDDVYNAEEETEEPSGESQPQTQEEEYEE